jgi:hypothetical protein
MKKQTRRFFAALALVAGAFALPAIAGAPAVAGKWTVSVHAPDHDFGIGLELKQDGNKVSGTLMMPDGDIALTGEMVEGAVVLNGTMEGGTGHGHGGAFKMTLKLKEDGTLAGDFASGGTKMVWTAERMKQR